MLEADVEADRREFRVAVQLAVAPGERLALFGPSGSGKTTTLEMIAGLVAPRRGRVALAGRVLTQTWAPRQVVPPWRRRIGLLRQDPAIFPHLGVRANLCYAAGERVPEPLVAALARQLGIGELLDDSPDRISGGQAHRVALGRLLLARCDALLLDEPYAGLDASLRRGLTDLVRTVVAQRQVPAILVAHELEAAQAFADRLAVLDRGRVLQAGTPAEVVARPVSRRVAGLVGYRGFVPVGPERAGMVAAIHPDRVTIAPAGAGRPGLTGLRDLAGRDLGGRDLGGRDPAGRDLGGRDPAGGDLDGRDLARGGVALAATELTLAGRVRGCRPAGAGWEVDVAVRGEVISCRLPARPAGEELAVIVADPPRYGPDGLLVTP